MRCRRNGKNRKKLNKLNEKLYIGMEKALKWIYNEKI